MVFNLNKKRIMVIKPDKGHSFWISKALLHNSCLDSLVTNIYFDNKRYNILFFLSKIMPKNILSRIKHRHDDELSKYVIQVNELLALICLFLYNSRFFLKLHDFLMEFLISNTHIKGLKIAAKRKVDAVIIGTQVNVGIVERFKNEHPDIKIIFDQTGLGSKYVYNILNVENYLYPDFCKEIGFTLPNTDDFDNLISLYKNVDLVINSGRFGKEIIEKDGYVSYDKNYYVDYGIDTKLFYNKHIICGKQSDVLKCIYVGNVYVLKGIPTLLTAFKELENYNISLTIIGKHNLSSKFIDNFSNVKFVGHILREDLNEYFNNSDVFIFPTLMDGFGMVVLEAMATGLPVICSKSCGAADAVFGGENGFLIEPHSYKDIIDKVLYFYYNRNQVAVMGESSLKKISQFSYDNYYKQYGEILREYFDGQHK